MATEIGTVIDGKYEVLKKIGQGGMSVVYLAMDKRLNKQWAVKEIRRTTSGRNDEVVINSLLAEANLMKRLDHPSLPRIVDIIENSETIYVIMDYIEGESLDKILKEYGAQSQELVVEWGKQLCDALSYLHRQNPPIIYRDMKPGNVMLKPEGNLKVIDFGIAREYKEKNLADTTVLGTKGYAPPEQHGSRQTDPRSDIYALGMTMHHLLTGADPRATDYMYVPIRQWNPSLSSGLERVIDKCTALDPEDRYQNCDELMYALDHYEEESEQFRKKQKGKLRLFVISLSLAVVFAVLGVVFNVLKISNDNNDYNKCVTMIDQGDSFTKAVKLKPAEIDAYRAYLEHNMDTKENIGIYCSAFRENLTDNGKSLKYTGSEYAELAKNSGEKILCSNAFGSSDNHDWRSAAKETLKCIECVKDKCTDLYNVCSWLSKDSMSTDDNISKSTAKSSCDNLINEYRGNSVVQYIEQIKIFIENQEG